MAKRARARELSTCCDARHADVEDLSLRYGRRVRSLQLELIRSEHVADVPLLGQRQAQAHAPLGGVHCAHARRCFRVSSRVQVRGSTRVPDRMTPVIA
jgi:hypothetical protein